MKTEVYTITLITSTKSKSVLLEFSPIVKGGQNENGRVASLERI